VGAHIPHSGDAPDVLAGMNVRVWIAKGEPLRSTPFPGLAVRKEWFKYCCDDTSWSVSIPD
jgi:hypothetical protein